MSTMTWGGSSLPLPAEDGIDINDQFIGHFRRLLDGTMVAQRLAEKATIDLRWHGLTEAEHDSLRTIYDTKYLTSSALVMPNGDSYSVYAINGWRSAPWHDGTDTAHWTVSIRFEEV